MPHINELYDFVITVMVVNKGRVLLVHHPRYDKWIPIGGHVEFDEDPEQALYREIAEETGLTVKLLTSAPEVVSSNTRFLPTPNYLDVHEANPPHRHISLTYFVASTSDAFTMSAEHSQMRWFEPAELHDPEYSLDGAIIFYAEQALKTASEQSVDE